MATLLTALNAFRKGNPKLLLEIAKDKAFLDNYCSGLNITLDADKRRALLIYAFSQTDLNQSDLYQMGAYYLSKETYGIDSYDQFIFSEFLQAAAECYVNKAKFIDLNITDSGFLQTLIARLSSIQKDENPTVQYIDFFDKSSEKYRRFTKIAIAFYLDEQFILSLIERRMEQGQAAGVEEELEILLSALAIKRDQKLQKKFLDLSQKIFSNQDVPESEIQQFLASLRVASTYEKFICAMDLTCKNLQNQLYSIIISQTPEAAAAYMNIAADDRSAKTECFGKLIMDSSTESDATVKEKYNSTFGDVAALYSSIHETKNSETKANIAACLRLDLLRAKLQESGKHSIERIKNFEFSFNHRETKMILSQCTEGGTGFVKTIRDWLCRFTILVTRGKWGWQSAQAVAFRNNVKAARLQPTDECELTPLLRAAKSA